MSTSPIDWRALVDEAIRRRKAEGLSQRSLAALAGVSVPTVNAFERGEVRLRFERVVAILNAVGLFTTPSPPDSLEAFVQAARARWSELAATPSLDPVFIRPLGYFEHAYSIEGNDVELPSPRELGDWLVALPRGQGWAPFSNSPGNPRTAVVDGLVEYWIGGGSSAKSDDPLSSDFWRIGRTGQAYMRRGFQEDGPNSLEPGTILDVSLPILRAGAVMRHAVTLAREAGSDEATSIRFSGRYTGLEGRSLLAWANPRLRSAADGRHRAVTPSIDLSAAFRLIDLENDLATAVTSLLRPLYERFEGFDLTREFAADQLGGAARKERVSVGPFAVDKSLVASLGDEALRELLGKLLEAEASTRGVPLSSIDLGGSQTAPDGGIDAAIQWQGTPEPSGWLPRRTIYYQCKAQVLQPAGVSREMRPKGALRPIFAELVEDDGAYIVFSTDDVGTKGQEARLAQMRATLEDLPGYEKIHVDFYGADRVARWVNQHPGVALWLLARGGRALGGWSPFGAWSSAASGGTPYLIDDTARASIDGGDADVRSAIAAMRGALGTPGGCVRLVGISGMGKTRLAEALFDPRVNAGKAPSPSLAIYADAGHELAMGAALVAEQLALSGVEAIIVVDNCAARTHAQLADIVRRKGSRVSLLTIDYDVGDDQPEGTLIVRLGDNSEGVLLALLKQRHPELSEGERSHLARFSEGNARLALAVARGSSAGVDLSKLNDDELLDRLFQADRSSDPAATRRAGDAASLVYAFHADPSDGFPVEHPVLASIAGLSPETFYRHVQVMLDWGIAQQRGPQRAVKPDPIANKLARKVLHESDPEALLATFRSGPERLFASFARRLGQFHDLPAAERIAVRLLSEGEWLGDPASQNSHQRRAFLNIAPAAPEAALAAIERALDGPDQSSISGPDHDRREFAELLVHIAYDEALFPRAMRSLLKLTLAEGGEERDTPTRAYFLERFWPVLSWTLAGTPARLALVDRLLDDDDDDVRALGVEALDHMLDASHFSSSFDPAFGSQLREKEWRPTGAAYSDWADAAYERLERTARSGEPEAERARQIAAEHLRGHLQAGVGDRAVAAMRKVRPSGFWDEGWRATNDALHFGRDESAPERLAAAAALELELRPKTLEECFEAFVLGEPWRHWHPSGREKGSIRDVELLAKAVGRRVIRSGADLAPFLRRASAAEGQTSVVPFGEGLGRGAPDLDALWSAAYRSYADTKDGKRNPGVLIGILKAADNRSRDWVTARLDEAMRDPLLVDHSVYLHAARNLGTEDVNRFLIALGKGGLSPERLSALMYGGATGTIPAADLARLMDTMIGHKDGALPALEVLYMRVHGDRTSKRPIAPELIAVARKLLVDRRSYESEHSRPDHQLAKLARLVFAEETGTGTAVGICRALRSAARRRDSWSRHDLHELADVLMKSHLRVVLDEIVAGAKDEGRRDLAGAFFGGWSADADHHQERKQIELDIDTLLDWVAEEPQARAERLAALVPYTTAGDNGGLAWSPLATALIQAAPDPLSVLRTFENRFWSGVSSGPFSGRYVRRRPLVEALKQHRDRRVRNWARETADEIEDRINHYDALDRNSDSRFE